MQLTEFLQQSYTAYHAAANGAAMLNEAGFIQLRLGEKWKLQQNKGYYLLRDGLLAAFTVGGAPEKSLSLAVCHTDSPALKLKCGKVLKSVGGNRADAEVYGGLALYSFLDLPLKLAGKAVVEQDGKLNQVLVTSPYNVVIPSLAIHHRPETNSALSLSAQCDMLPLVGAVEELYSTLSCGKVVDADLYAAVDVSPRICGANGEYLLSPRIDNLTSVYACVRGIASCKPVGVSMICCLDNEEIGSNTLGGAASNFLSEFAAKVYCDLGLSSDDFAFAKGHGIALSVDNAHALHPAHPEKSTPETAVALNCGIVVKHHINYATESCSSAAVKKMLQSCNLPFADYCNNSSVHCGSTVGHTVSSRLGIRTCDVGLAQLAMHCGCETVGSADVERMNAAIKAFLCGEAAKYLP